LNIPSIKLAQIHIFVSIYSIYFHSPLSLSNITPKKIHILNLILPVINGHYQTNKYMHQQVLIWKLVALETGVGGMLYVYKTVEMTLRSPPSPQPPLHPLILCIPAWMKSVSVVLQPWPRTMLNPRSKQKSSLSHSERK
jgi:hypothetical protein